MLTPENITLFADREFKWDFLSPLRLWLGRREIHDRSSARLLCCLIPAACPFERDIYLFGRVILHVPPLCHLNPLYEELVALRFRALCYLADGGRRDIRGGC